MAKNFSAWPKDWPRSLNYPDLPVYAFLDQTAERVPDRIAIHFGGMELTYGELKILADRFAGALDGLGVKKGDRVAIHLVNCPQFAIAYYGAMKIGAVFTPLNPLMSHREAKHQLDDSGAETLISLDLVFPGIQGILSETGVKHIITTSIADCYNAVIAPVKPLAKIEAPDTLDMAGLLQKSEPFDREVAIDVKTDLAHIAYTGGTTGVSKGVMMSHANIVANVLQANHWFSGAGIELVDGRMNLVFPEGVDPERDRIGVRDRDTCLVVVPWFHAMGTVGYLNQMVYGGLTMVVFARFDPVEYIGSVEKFKANILGGAPQLFIPLVNLPDFDSYDLSGIKLAVSGAAPLAGAVMDRMLDAFPGVVCEAYGLSECAMLATSNPPDREAIRLGSVGLPVFDTECKVVDVVTGQDLPPGSEGEICIKGPQLMVGYWNRPEATAEVLTEDGWLLTGDVGREDEDGYFFITDRKKDMILYKGYNVYPRELEEVIFEHPAVQQCAVVGKPDLDTGEFPVAFVELKQGFSATEDDIMRHTNTQVTPYKKIREVVFMDSIPVSAAGKVLKRELREMIAKE